MELLKSFDYKRLTETSLQIFPGYMFAYGYIGCTMQPKTFYFNKVSTTQYHFIYCEINMSVIPNTCELKIKNNQSGEQISDNTFRQDNLGAIKTGIFQLPLYRVHLGIDGISYIDDLRPNRNYIKCVREASTARNVTRSIDATARLEAHPPLSDRSNRVASVGFVAREAWRYLLYGDTGPYIITIYPVEATETGKVSFSPDMIQISRDNPEAIFRVNVEDGWQIADYRTLGGSFFSISDLGQGRFEVELVDWTRLEQNEEFSIIFDIEEQ